MNNQGVKPKKKYSKFLLGFLVIIFLVIGAWQILPVVFQKWGEMRVERLAENLRKIEEEGYKAAMADTYGGKTPQETLRMYIEAVEKGDYELASKYFVIGKQEEELKSLQNSKPENIRHMLDILQNTKVVDLRAELAKRYDAELQERTKSESKEDYINRLYKVWDYDNKAWMSSKADGYDFSISFIRYPNGIWKIIEF